MDWRVHRRRMSLKSKRIMILVVMKLVVCGGLAIFLPAIVDGEPTVTRALVLVGWVIGLVLALTSSTVCWVSLMVSPRALNEE